VTVGALIARFAVKESVTVSPDFAKVGVALLETSVTGVSTGVQLISALGTGPVVVEPLTVPP
jgi:hypothetical protein